MLLPAKVRLILDVLQYSYQSPQGLYSVVFTKKTPSSGYRDSHYKPEMVGRPSQVYNGDSCTQKMVSFNSLKPSDAILAT